MLMNESVEQHDYQVYLSNIDSGDPLLVSESADYFCENGVEDSDVPVIVKAFWKSSDTDVRSDLVRILASIPLHESFDALEHIYYKSPEPKLSRLAGDAIYELAREDPGCWETIPAEIRDAIIYDNSPASDS